MKILIPFTFYFAFFGVVSASDTDIPLSSVELDSRVEFKSNIVVDQFGFDVVDEEKRSCSLYLLKDDSRVLRPGDRLEVIGKRPAYSASKPSHLVLSGEAFVNFSCFDTQHERELSVAEVNRYFGKYFIIEPAPAYREDIDRIRRDEMRQFDVQLKSIAFNDVVIPRNDVLVEKAIVDRLKDIGARFFSCFQMRSVVFSSPMTSFDRETNTAEVDQGVILLSPLEEFIDRYAMKQRYLHVDDCEIEFVFEDAFLSKSQRSRFLYSLKIILAKQMKFVSIVTDSDILIRLDNDTGRFIISGSVQYWAWERNREW